MSRQSVFLIRQADQANGMSRKVSPAASRDDKRGIVRRHDGGSTGINDTRLGEVSLIFDPTGRVDLNN